MQVVITGAAGFLGSRLARVLLERGRLAGAAGGDEPIERLTLVDVAQPPAFSDPRVDAVTGDLADPAVARGAIGSSASSVFHLAAVVSGMAEAQFDVGMRVNLDGTRQVLEACRASGRRPRLVFASSVAVFGGDLPQVVLDSTPLNPQTSYGVQKATGELLVGDYSRRGFVDGRSLRLPTITVRPGKPNAAASSFASGIVREPLSGHEAICPVGPDARMWLMSPSTVIASLIHAHDLPSEALGVNRALNLPGITVTVGEMAAALERVAGRDVAGRIKWQKDERIAGMVAGWPGRFDPARARSLGFPSDESFDEIIRAYMAEMRLAGS